ncbi:hypothetical protein RYX36_012351 [Vicia faba]
MRNIFYLAMNPFAEANAEDSGVGAGIKEYVHVRVQQRNGRKSLTTVQGLKKEFSYSKILKDLKKEFCCNGKISLLEKGFLAKCPSMLIDDYVDLHKSKEMDATKSNSGEKLGSSVNRSSNQNQSKKRTRQESVQNWAKVNEEDAITNREEEKGN